MRRSVVLGAAIVVPVCIAMTILSLVSCSGGRVERQAAEVSAEGWSEPVTWNYDNRNAQSVNDVAFVFDFAGGVAETDLVADLADSIFAVEVVFPSGRRFDTAISPVVDGELTLRMIASPAAPFDEQGIYKFTLTPLTTATGIKSVALELVPTTGGADVVSEGRKQI